MKKLTEETETELIREIQKQEKYFEDTICPDFTELKTPVLRGQIRTEIRQSNPKNGPLTAFRQEGFNGSQGQIWKELKSFLNN